MNAVHVLNAKTMQINYIAMDRADRAKGSPLKNKKVWLAIAYAIDRATISRELVGCSSIVIHSACFPSQFCCTQDVLKYRYVPVLEWNTWLRRGVLMASRSICLATANANIQKLLSGVWKTGIKAYVKLTLIKCYGVRFGKAKCKHCYTQALLNSILTPDTALGLPNAHLGA
jgi:hypothetical protein